METRMNLRAKVLVFACGVSLLVGMATIGGLRLAYAEPVGEAHLAGADQALPKPSDVGARAGALLGALTGELVQNMTKADIHADRFDFRGQVLDPNGKPRRGARIYIIFHSSTKVAPPKLRATTDSGGKFHFTMEKSEFDKLRSSKLWGIHDDVDYKNDCRIVAVADACGPAWLPAYAFDNSGEVLKRVLQAHPDDADALREKVKPVLSMVRDDVPLLGRVVDTKNKPVAGVKLRVEYLDPTINEDLTGWLNTVAKPDADVVKTMAYFSKRKVSHGSMTDNAMSSQEFPQLMPTTVSDADGKFRLSGIGRERIVGLSIEGPGIASAVEVFARTRPGPTFVIPYHAGEIPNNWTFYGATFEYVARPSVPIVGTVRDKDTGNPLPAVTIQGFKLAGNPVPGYVASHCFKSITDKEGHYRLTGMPTGKDNELLAVPSKDQPYLLSKKTADTAGGKDPLQVDFELKRGIWIRGKVIDAKTGKPVPCCSVDYYVFLDNPHVKSAPGFRGAYQYFSYQTDKDGHYALPGLPGRGILVVKAWWQGMDRYPLRVGIEKIPELCHAGGVFTKVAPTELYMGHINVLAEVNPPEGAESVQQDFKLDPGQTLTGMVLDPAGKSLTGAHYSGLIEDDYWNPLSSDTFTINCYRPDHPRKLLFVHLERKLAGSRIVEGIQPSPFSVQLQPWGVITGRVVDAAGKPIVGAQMEGHDLPRQLWQKDAGGQFHYLDRVNTTGRDGRFRIEGLAPGVKYNLSVWDKPKGKYFDELISAVTVQPGQTKDLGNLTVNPFKESAGGKPKPPRPAATPANSTAQTTTRAQQPEEAYRIRPLDLLTIHGVGTLIVQPIDGTYLVEPDGQVALGPSYGRANVEGMSPEQAERTITRQLQKVLMNPTVQVREAGRATQWRKAVPPKAPYTINKGNWLFICVSGTMIDSPILGFYQVESEGTVALGPVYGRARVEGLTLEGAERAIEKKLTEVLKRVEVEVTAAQWQTAVPPKAPYTISPGDLLFVHIAGQAIRGLSIHGVFPVEPPGTIPLGPGLGQAKVEGLTLEGAQKAIYEHLKVATSTWREKLATLPDVSVTLGGWMKDHELRSRR
jgi:protein involved in polysaccharide export with SLBB domain/protocatechuate 3,4-dioxygenase beta subunit